MMKTDDNNFIKVFDLAIAKKLKAEGFFYITEKINGKDVFVFPRDYNLYNLLKHLKNNYSKDSFIIENTLRF